MEPAPVIITVTDLRRSASRVIDSATESGAPVFVTQNGRATAVLLSRERYDDLLRGALPADMASRLVPTRPALVETQFGRCDPETAAFLAEEGFGPRTSTPRS